MLMFSKTYREDADIKEIQNFVMRNSGNIEIAIFNREWSEKSQELAKKYLSDDVLITYSNYLKKAERGGYNNSIQKKQEVVRFYGDRGEETMIITGNKKTFKIKMFNRPEIEVEARRITMRNGFVCVGNNMYKVEKIASIEEVEKTTSMEEV